jgi:hypothetical protein
MRYHRTVLLTLVVAAVVFAATAGAAEGRSLSGCSYKMRQLPVYLKFTNASASDCRAFESTARNSIVRLSYVRGAPRCQWQMGQIIATMYGDRVFGPIACKMMGSSLGREWKRIF